MYIFYKKVYNLFNMEEGVYLIHTRECINTNKCIYKFGRSNTVTNRIRQYPQESNVELTMSCRNSIFCEKEILKLLRAKFVNSTLYGSEYFEGDKHLMIQIIFNFINGRYNTTKNVSKNRNNNKIENKNIIKNEKQKIENKPTIRLPINKDQKIITDYNENNAKSRETKCNKCEIVFKYPSVLRAHLKNSSRCKIIKEENKIQTNDEITNNEIINNEITDNQEEIEEYTILNKKINNKTIKCNLCQNTFSCKSSLTRHNLYSKCSKMKKKKR